MSIFGAMNTAVSGLNAQSAAFGNISDNVANSTTIGYKEVGTSFSDYLTTSTAQLNDPGSVVATPDYENTLQGTVTQTSTATNLAVSGQGFFAVSQATSETNGTATFSPQQLYTRAGDFSMNKDGYLVNSSGDFLNGWPVDANGVASQNSLAPIQVTQTSTVPHPTTEVTLSANLPASPATSPITSTVNVYDHLGTEQQLNLSWAQTSTNNWNLTTTDSNATDKPVVTQVAFNPATGAITTPASGAVSLTCNFSGTSQAINLKLGSLTQYAGTQYTAQGVTQDGVPPGAYTNTTIQSNGDVVANYDNGQTVTIAQVPLITFNDPNALQSQNGQAYTATQASGTAVVDQENTAGAGNLVTSAVESSNVDIGTEFTKLIVAQQAYSANAKMVTTANQLLQTTIDMKQ